MRRTTRSASVLLAVLVSGCAPGITVSAPPSAIGAAAVPPGANFAPPLPTAQPTDCDPRGASLRPLGPLPAPGAMPEGSTMRRVQDRGRLIAGVDQNLNLFGSRHPHTGRLEGFDIDIVRAIAAAILGDPDKIQFRAVNFENNIDVLEKGGVDIVADSMTITCARLARVDMSIDYFDSGQRVLVRKDSTVDDIDDLAGQRVCAPNNTTSLRRIAERPVRPALIPVGVTEWTDCLVLLQQDQVAAVSTTDSVLIGLRAQDPTTKLVGPRFSDEPHGLAIARNQADFLRFVNGVLERMRADGSWKALHQKWLRDLDPDPRLPEVRYAQEGGR